MSAIIALLLILICCQLVSCNELLNEIKGILELTPRETSEPLKDHPTRQ